MNNYTTTTTMDRGLDMMSLFDYLGRAAGSELGKLVAHEAAIRGIPIEKRHVSNKKYTGDILLYPKNFLDIYFGSKTNDLPEIDYPLPF